MPSLTHICIFLFGLTSTIYAYHPQLLPEWNFYANNHLSTKSSGRGLTGVSFKEGLTNTLLNPATLHLKTDSQLQLNYGYKNNIKYTLPHENIDLNSVSPIYQIGYGFKVNKNVSSGLLYASEHSIQEDFGDIIETELNPETGEFEAVGTSKVLSNFTVTSITVPISIHLTKQLRLGVNLSSKTYKNKVTFSGSSQYIGSDINETHIVPDVGFVLSPTRHLSFGGSYTPEITVANTVIPKKIRLGSSLSFTAWTVLLDGHYTNTAATQSFDGQSFNNYHDKINLHFGSEYRVSDTWTMRFGLYTKQDIRKERSVMYSTNLKANADQTFLTLGSSLQLHAVSIDLAIMDSHLLSTEKVKQTYLNLGFSIDV